jgi:hypothetical protein
VAGCSEAFDFMQEGMLETLGDSGLCLPDGARG